MPARVITEGYGTGTNLLITEGFGISIDPFVEPVCIARVAAKLTKASVDAKIIVARRLELTDDEKHSRVGSKVKKASVTAKVKVARTEEKTTIVREGHPCE